MEVGWEGMQMRDRGWERGALLGLFVLRGQKGHPVFLQNQLRWQKATRPPPLPSIYVRHGFLSVTEILLDSVPEVSGQRTLETLFIFAAWVFLSGCQHELS